MLVRLVLLLSALATLTSASPYPVDSAKRSYTSGGMTCYYTCPNQSSYLGESCSFTSSSGGTCTYTCGAGTIFSPAQTPTCTYDPTTGILTSESNSFFCPSSVAATCGGSQGNTQFKRSTEKRELSAAERLIAARQYKPPKPLRKR